MTGETVFRKNRTGVSGEAQCDSIFVWFGPKRNLGKEATQAEIVLTEPKGHLHHGTDALFNEAGKNLPRL